MTSDPHPDRHRPKVTLAMPDGALRRRVLDVLAGTDVAVEVIDVESLAAGMREAEGDVVLFDQGQVDAADLDSLRDLAEDEDGAGVALVGDGEDPVERARLLAAGLSGVVRGDQRREDLAMSLEALAEAEALGGRRGPEVRGAEGRPRLADFLTRSPRMKEFVDLVQRVIDADTPLLVTGPTGVGKEHLARAIHAEGPRAAGPFVDVNCAALPEQLLEAELFGHRKGAFTGADRDRKGHFERANGGTVFLDEVGEMPLHLQVKLLTVLQRHEITPVGAERPIGIDVRVVAATNRDLQQRIAAGEFREDLFYRLSVVPLRIPALAERPEDVPDMVGRFIQHFRSAMPTSACTGVSAAALEALTDYSWPGNVRELINVVERAMLLGKGTEITLGDLPPAIVQRAPAPGAPSPDVEDAVPEEWLSLPIKEMRELAVARAETAYLRAILASTRGRLGEAAKRIGLSNRALYEKMKRYDLRKEDYRGG